MGLTRLAATGRLHLFLVEAPGFRALRIGAEAAGARAGHVLATSPADADALLVCGSSGPELAAAIDRVWAQVPRPRARGVVTAAEEIDQALGRLAALVGDDATQRGQVAERRTAAGHPRQGDDQGDHKTMPPADHEHPSHGNHDPMAPIADGTMAHGGHDMGGHDMGGHDMGGHGHGGMHMSGPRGYPLAHGAEDRDGLEMDVLHRTLGPIMPGWPAGLVVHVTLAGDTITAARTELLDGARSGRGDDGPGLLSIVRCDSVARLLELAGWRSAADRILRVRDLILHDARDQARVAFGPAARRVGRSRVLRWSLRGLDADSGVSVHRRLLDWLDDIGNDLHRATPRLPVPRAPDGIPELITGHDLGSARLIMAAQDLDLIGPATAAGRSDDDHDHGMVGHG